MSAACELALVKISLSVFCAFSGSRFRLLSLSSEWECAMTQAELDHAVAEATGESVRTIVRHGFVLLTAGPVEREPLVIDWDELDAGAES